jgi:hypothetical protein
MTTRGSCMVVTLIGSLLAVAASGMPNPPGSCGSTRLGGERRGEEAAGKGADECPPIHHSIT